MLDMHVRSSCLLKLRTLDTVVFVVLNDVTFNFIEEFVKLWRNGATGVASGKKEKISTTPNSAVNLKS